MTIAAESKGGQRRTENLVSRYGEREGLFPAGARVVVGISGGPDSTALLLILEHLSAKRSLHLIAAYFDHQLRGAKAATLEMRAVRELARGIGLELVCGRGDVRAFARSHHLSIEEAARRARYGFLGRTATDAGAELIAVGHTLDDQAETVLMHVLRGAGLAGVAGMAARGTLPIAGFEAISLVRPLLRVRRADTLAYCRAAGVEPVEDESNRSTVHLRNRLRHELMPMLRTFNPNVAGALNRLSEAAHADLDFIQSGVGSLVVCSGREALLDRALLRAAHPALRREAVKMGVRALLGDVQGFGERHWRALDAAIDGPTGAHLDLPRSTVADVLRDAVRLGLRDDQSERPVLKGVLHLPVPGVADFGAWRFAAGRDPVSNCVAAVEVAAVAAGESISVRSRKPGDRFQPAGLEGTKKLQDFFTDAHVPRDQRDSIPVFETSRGIIWVGGLRIADWAKCRPDEAAVCLSYAPSSAGAAVII